MQYDKFCVQSCEFFCGPGFCFFGDKMTKAEMSKCVNFEFPKRQKCQKEMLKISNSIIKKRVVWKMSSVEFPREKLPFFLMKIQNSHTTYFKKSPLKVQVLKNSFDVIFLSIIQLEIKFKSQYLVLPIALNTNYLDFRHFRCSKF